MYNAGIMPASFLVKNCTDEWDRIIDINIKGSPYSTVYCMTKHAVKNISSGLRQEEAIAGSKIRVTDIGPGMVDTELVSTIIEPEMKAVADQLFSDKSKMITPEQIADAVIYSIEQPEHTMVTSVVIQPNL